MSKPPPPLYEVEDGSLIFNFHDGQLRAWDCRRRFVMVLAGTQGGKTSWGPWWLWREIQNTARPGELNDYLAVSSSYDLFKLKMLPALREAIEHTLGIGRYWSGDRIIELADPATGKFLANRVDDPMWGRIILRSAAGGGGLESATGKAAWLDEAGQDEYSLEIWEAVLRRLSLSQGRVLVSTTVYNLGYLKQMFDKWQAGNFPEGEFIQFASVSNPAFPREEYERARRTMPPHRFEMFYHGNFAQPAGLIFDCFEEAIHVVEDFPIPANWPRYVGIDFGAVNTALVWIAEDVERDRYVAYRESLEGGKSTDEHAAGALKLAQGENVVQWLGGSPSETQQRMDWNSAGVPVAQPYISDVEAGIDRPYALFKTKRLFVFRSCIGLRDELGTYKRKLDAQGQPLEEIENKRKFHRLDALRYNCSALRDVQIGFAPNPWG